MNAILRKAVSCRIISNLESAGKGAVTLPDAQKGLTITATIILLLRRVGPQPVRPLPFARWADVLTTLSKGEHIYLLYILSALLEGTDRSLEILPRQVTITHELESFLST